MSLKVKAKFDGRKIKDAVQKAAFTSFGHAAAAIRLTARRSIKKRAKASAPGSPPNTRQGRLKNAIQYAVDAVKLSALIGPEYRIAADSGKAHEFGGRYRNEIYPRRPFMGPALEKNKSRLPHFWAASVK